MDLPRQRLLMDRGWKFAFGCAGDAAKDFGYGTGVAFAKAGVCPGPADLAFDDAAWRTLDLPHDWAVELPFDEKANSMHGFKPVGPEFPATSVGWYRRVFEAPREWEGKRLTVEFDGAFRDCRVFLNGHYVGANMCGYNSFLFDVSDLLAYGEKNVLTVRVDASGFEGWFYEGAGIYRHVWMNVTEPVALGHWSTFVSSKVSPGAAAAVLTLRTTVENVSDTPARCQVSFTVVAPDGRTVAKAKTAAPVPAAGNKDIRQLLTVKKPALWSLEEPQRYRLIVEVRAGKTLLDVQETAFGIRTVEFSATKGFLLNGQVVKLKGVCCHQDHAGVGMALPDSLQEFRIRRLLDMGCNALRTSHNQPTPELLDVCDRLGMLVMDETRQVGTSREVLAELESLIRRDRNHPSVVIWSLGNEEMKIQGTPVGARIARTMKRLARRLDPTRPVTIAMNGAWGEGFSHVVDVQGCNYLKCGDGDAFHAKLPRVPVVYSEAGCGVSTRGQYAEDDVRCFLPAYDVCKAGWADSNQDTWSYVAKRPWIGGMFVWTGFDYRGEPIPYNKFPCVNSHFGIMDVCGFPKDKFYYFQAQWRPEPIVHILPHWNWPGREGQDIDVWVHSNCQAVELLLNGRSLGRQTVEPYQHTAWKVPYEPGVLEARGYIGRKTAARGRVETTGPAAAITLCPDRTKLSADGQDAVPVAAAVVDAQGCVVPTAENLIRFTLTGPGQIIGVGNGNPSSLEPDKASGRMAFAGLCQVILQAGLKSGALTLTAESDGLAGAALTIPARRARGREQLP
ncbi:MAG: DUF4982 domain-containing protein [Planctomycetota bacterium]|nr:DUF4982 domain-containing protein [Planctomycetota bacterium]